MQRFRGYIASRPIQGERTAQHVQNLVVADYAKRQGAQYLLSAVEYAMPGCFMMLEALLQEPDGHDGIVCYSIRMLPDDRARRQALIARVLAAGKELHGALEGLAIRNRGDAQRLDDLLRLDRLLPHCATDHLRSDGA